MTADIVSILTVDGAVTGAVYVLVAIGTVLIFTVTRVVYIPFGDIAAFTALTLAAIESHKMPGTIGLVLVLSFLAALIETVSLMRGRRFREIPRALLLYLLLPVLIVEVARFALGFQLPMALQIMTALALMVPVAPLLDRIVFRPIADASVLLLFIVAMALHFALVGLGLLFFGPEGVRTAPLTTTQLDLGWLQLSGQSLIIVIAAVVLSAVLFLFFDFTIAGKSLRATAMNRTGARLMGIRPARSAAIAYIVGSLMAGVSGILIAPVNTIFYDSGFLLGLKAFVGAIIGGLVSYPGTVLGSLAVGLLESFAAFESSALKDVIVFSLLIPILLWRSLNHSQSEEEIEE